MKLADTLIPIEKRPCTASGQAALSVIFGASIAAAAMAHDVTQEAVAHSLAAAKTVRGIYALWCPINGAVRYVGSSADCNKRLMGHKNINGRRANERAWLRWFADLMQHNMQMQMAVLSVVPSDVELICPEIEWINHYRRLGQVDLNLNLVAKTEKKG